MGVINNPNVIAPRKPTWQRYRKLIVSGYTLFRTLTYEIVAAENFKGKVLDVGGGEKTSYRKLLNINGTYESINYSNDIDSSIIGDIEKGLPVPDAAYDTVISLNTLEHIYNIDLAIDEIHRVVKKGGSVFIEVPFIFRGHGSPDDFHRKTHSWWTRRMKIAGFESITVEPIMWDVRSVGFSMTERIPLPFIPYKIRRAFALLYGLVHSVIVFRDNSDRIPAKEVLLWQDFALGFAIKAKKPF